MAIFTRPKEERVSPPTAPWPAGNGHRPAALDAARGALRRRWGWLVAAAVLAAGSLVAVEVTAASSTYPVDAVFAQAPGLFAGAAVEVLGVPVGTVTSVRNVGDEVRVRLAIDHGHAIPATATASLVAPEILGEPSIDLSPGYTGGPAMRPGAVIPMSRTAVPVSTEQVLKSLRTTLQRIDPHAVGDLITNLAQDLDGQGKNLNTLISGAAGTLKLLATKADDLGQLNGSLAQLTGALDSRTAQITQLITGYDTVSGVIAQHTTELGNALVQFSQASTELVQLLVPNLGPIETDVGTITTVGRTLDRNLTSVDEVFAAATALFTGARRAYTSTYNWLTLNAQTPTGLTGAILESTLRSRLAGVCRRILANHVTGLSTAERKTLETCSSPDTAFFDSVLSQVPTVVKDVQEGKMPSPTSAAQVLQKGLAKIPGATTASGSAAKKGSSKSTSGASSASPGTASGSSSKTPDTTTSRTSPTQKTCLGGLFGAVGCTAQSGSGSHEGTTSPDSSTTSGLAAYDVPASQSSAPSLSANAASELPPLPASAPGATSWREASHASRTGSRPHGARPHGARRRTIPDGGAS